MKVNIINLVAVFSLLLSLSIGGLWMRSYWRSDDFQQSGRQWVFSASKGRIWFVHTSRPYWTGDGYRVHPVSQNFEKQFDRLLTVKSTESGRLVSVIGFAYTSHYDPFFSCKFIYVGVPLWLFVAFTMVPPLLAVRRRLSRVAPGCCQGCGYDLRATPNRCPECGAVSATQVS